MSAIKLSVIVPCYNEEKRFEKGFEHYFTYLSKQKYPWELIFVNDGSQDQTLKLMKESAKNHKQVKILSHQPNQGKGYAIVQGVKASQGRYILFTDLDHSVPIDTIESFFKHFEKGHKIIIGSRRVKGAQLIIRQPLVREFLGRGFTFLVNVLIYWGVKDATCGFKAFENKAAQKIFSKVTIYDWAFDAEILYICKKLKLKFLQAPVIWSNSKGSKVMLFKDVLSSVKGLLQIRLNDLLGKYD